MAPRAAHARGDARAIWLLLDGKLEELTPLEDTHAAASEMTRALGQRCYLKRRYDPLEHVERWTAHDASSSTFTQMKPLPSRDAAIMWAIHRSAR